MRTCTVTRFLCSGSTSSCLSEKRWSWSTVPPRCTLNRLLLPIATATSLASFTPRSARTLRGIDGNRKHAHEHKE